VLSLGKSCGAQPRATGETSIHPSLLPYPLAFAVRLSWSGAGNRATVKMF